MTKEEARKRIEKLKEVINYHRYLYHVLDRQEISDAALDSLKHELYELEQRYPEFITPDSPTQRVGGKPLDKFEKVKHRFPMLSLEDVFTLDELKAWEIRNKKLLPFSLSKKIDYFCELKIDGFGVSLEYKNGIFVRGSTRGDGLIGEDITQNLKTISSIPLKLRKPSEKELKKLQFKEKEIWLIWQSIDNKEIEVRGEVYMNIKDFEEVNRERQNKGEPLYANPRNTAAGSIRQLDPKIAASRKLNFLAYDLITDLGQKTHQREHQLCRLLGFKSDEGKYCSNLKEVVEFWKKIKKLRQKLPYQIDGVVVNINNNEVFEKLGVVGKAPRGAIAFKFPAKQATTVVKDIIVQVGRTGTLTPVAILKPVRLGGTIISRATLHNEDEIKRLDVRIGDTVIVQRAGDVIPDVVSVIKKLRTGKEKKFVMPLYCPVCGSRIVRLPGEVAYRCPNPNCGARQRRNLYHFVSRKAFDIIGLGPKIIDQLINENLINDPSDIFQLKEGDLLPLERFAEKSSTNLINSIEKSKRISLSRFIYALGIRHIGEETALLLAEKLWQKKQKIRNVKDFIQALSSCSKEELYQIKDIGEKVAQGIYQWIHNRRNLSLLRKLDKVGIVFEESAKPSLEKTKLAGKNFVLTGELSSMTREEAREKIHSLGGKVSESVSKKTDFVVVGKNPGSKYRRAKELKIKILNEKEFINMIKD